MGKLRIGSIYRYARPYSRKPEVIDGYPNYFFETDTPGFNLPILDRGISPIGRIDAPEGTRTPAFLISSSPHKAGSEGTPWQDLYDVDNGYIRYFGDNKSTNPAGQAQGNKALYEQFQLHTSSQKEDREKAVPILFLAEKPSTADQRET